MTGRSDALAQGQPDLDSPTRHPNIRVSLAAAQPQTLHLRDGEVIVYRRSRSLRYQCRYKLADGTWVRRTTGKASLEGAVTEACNLDDEARFRQRLGLAHRAHSFAQIAALTLADLRLKIEASSGKTAYHDYAACIERYLLPYFGERQLEDLTHTDMREFKSWRGRQMGRKPKHSTAQHTQHR